MISCTIHELGLGLWGFSASEKVQVFLRDIYRGYRKFEDWIVLILNLQISLHFMDFHLFSIPGM